MRDLGVLNDGSGWPRRSCIRKEHYRLDMNTRINGKYTTEDNEDLFFVDIEEYPNEDVNQADSPKYREIIKEMRNMLLKHIENSIEVPKEFITLPNGLKAETIQ